MSVCPSVLLFLVLLPLIIISAPILVTNSVSVLT